MISINVVWNHHDKIMFDQSKLIRLRCRFILTILVWFVEQVWAGLWWSLENGIFVSIIVLNGSQYVLILYINYLSILIIMRHAHIDGANTRQKLYIICYNNHTYLLDLYWTKIFWGKELVCVASQSYRLQMIPLSSPWSNGRVVFLQMAKEFAGILVSCTVDKFTWVSKRLFVCVCVCVRACVRACVYVRVCACTWTYLCQWP